MRGHTVFHVIASCRVPRGSLEAQLTDRPDV